MRRFLRCSVAALGVASPALAQPGAPAPPVAPAEVRPLVADAPAALEPASAPKPPPAQLEQPAVPTVPPPPHVDLIRPVSADDERPAYLPPVDLGLLPQPPRSGPLPPIPVAPVLAAPPQPAPAATPDAPPVWADDSRPPLPEALRRRGGAPVAATPTPDAEEAAEAADPLGRVADAGAAPEWHEPARPAARVAGWLSGGYVYNTSNPRSRFNGPYNAIDRSAELMLNQAYLSAERRLPTEGLGYGWRADAVFGTDHFRAQSRGFETDRDFGPRWNGQFYGLALPQLYGAVGSDVLALKVGHFYTPLGYEVLPAPGNFFYTRAYSFQFGQPITHWGGLLTSQLTRTVSAYAGAVNGWDTLVGRSNNANLLAGVKYESLGGGCWGSFGLVTGQEQNNPGRLPGIGGTDGNRSRYSLVLGLTPGGPDGRWEYVFHHHYGFQENGTASGNLARWYGIDQYLYYRATQKLRVGGRVEWFRDEDGTRVGLGRPANPNVPPLPGNFFALTGGLNYAPTAHLLVRPEVRIDFTSDTARRPFNDGRKAQQYLFGCDVIWQF